jgi:hypothetical protein
MADMRIPRRTASVSHQKRPPQGAMNAREISQKRRKINDDGLYPGAHNGLVAGSSPAGPTKEINQSSLF